MDSLHEAEIRRFVGAAREALGADLVSVVLFGSAAEDRLRPTSDVNVALVLRRFDPQAIAKLRGELVLASAAIRLRPMFLLEGEVAEAAGAFGVKFADIRRRHKVLHGPDPFAALDIPRAAAIAELRRVLLNLLLRMRADLALRGDHEEQLALVIADAAGPLRACAAELLALAGEPAPSPREALERVAGRPLPALSEAREKGRLAPGAAPRELLALVELCHDLRSRAETLS